VDRPQLATPSETTTSSSSSGDAQQQQQLQQASACPFLASLPSPPQVKIPWHKRFQQLFAPQQFQATVLSGSSGSSVVQVDKAIGFTNFVMPNDPELVREAFAGELDGTTLQSNIKSFGERGLMGVMGSQLGDATAAVAGVRSRSMLACSVCGTEPRCVLLA
jgi:hypothetical protein